MASYTKLTLFATNTIELYDTHLQLASDDAPVFNWFVHIIKTILPLYRNEINEGAIFSDADLWEAAKYLHSYYSTLGA